MVWNWMQALVLGVGSWEALPCQLYITQLQGEAHTDSHVTVREYVVPGDGAQGMCYLCNSHKDTFNQK